MSLGFYFDATRCTGCRTCQIACKDRMDIQDIGPRPRSVITKEAGEFPNVRMFHIAMACNHCENPACTEACPTGAMYKDGESGIVLHDDDACIQCQSCVQACPYGAPQYVDSAAQIYKCDSCKALREGGYNPVCVDACPMRALDFGEMDDLRQKYGADLTADFANLPDSSGTAPNLLIKPMDLGAGSPAIREIVL